MAKWLLVGALLLGAVLDLTILFAGDQLLQLLGLDESQFLEGLVFPVWVGWVAVYAVASVVALVDALLRLRRRDIDGLQLATRVVKLGGIPFFAVNFVLLGLGGLVASITPSGVILGPLFVIGTYLVMLPTSVYGLACLVLLLRDRAIGSGFFVVNVILHLMFVVDVISTLVVAHRAKQALAGYPGSADRRRQARSDASSSSTPMT